MTKSTDTCSGNPGSCNRADIQQVHQHHDSLKWKYEYFRMQKKTLSLMKTTTFTLQHSLVLKEDNKIVNCSVANHTFCDMTIFCDMSREFRWPKYFLCCILWFWLVSSLKSLVLWVSMWILEMNWTGSGISSSLTSFYPVDKRPKFFRWQLLHLQD